MKMKNIAVLGSTGSIGTQTLDVARNNEDIRIVALSAGSNIELLEQQAREFSPEVVSVAEKKDAEKLRKKLEGTGVKVLWGMDGLIEAAQHPSADTVVTAVVGMMGLRPTVAAINAGKDIALANKETLVTAGHIIMPLEIADLGGLDTFYNISSYLFEDLSDAKEVSSILADLVKAGNYGVKSGKGFYDYSDGRDKEVIRKRDEDFYKITECLFGEK